jgi:hypothetical protein
MPEFKRIREFKAAPGAGFSDDEAQRFGEFLELKVGLGQRPVSAEKIVEAARPKRSPIHKVIFSESDEDAAFHHRCGLARHLVRHIVVMVAQNGGEVETRAFHHVATESTEERGYIASREVWRRPELAEQVVRKALVELRSWRQRYSQYSELAAVIGRIDEVLDEAA